MRQWTPARRARHMADATYDEVVPQAAAALGVNLADSAVRTTILLMVGSHSPREPLGPQLAHIREACSKPIRHPRDNVDTPQMRRWEADNDELGKRVWEMIMSGAEPATVHALIDSEQAWPWAAYVTDRAAFERELVARYRLGVCEVEHHWHAVPGGLLIHCHVRPYAWAAGGR